MVERGIKIRANICGRKVWMKEQGSTIVADCIILSGYEDLHMYFFNLVVMQVMFSTKVANLLTRCHPAYKANFDKAAFFSCFFFNKV